MKDTIKAKYGYRVRKVRNIFTGEEMFRIDDGLVPICIVKKRSYEDYKCDMANNEAATTCEIFTTVHGNQFIYWRDNEIDEDFITKVE